MLLFGRPIVFDLFQIQRHRDGVGESACPISLPIPFAITVAVEEVSRPDH